MAFGNDWTPDWSGYQSGGRSTEAMPWKGGKPEQIWRERGPDAYREWLEKGQQGAYDRRNDREYYGNPASWYESRINAFDFWRAEQNRQPAYPDLSGDLADTNKQLADLQSQFDAYRDSVSTPAAEAAGINYLDTTGSQQPLGGVSQEYGTLDGYMPMNYLDSMMFGGGWGLDAGYGGSQNWNYNPMPDVQQQYREPLSRVNTVRPAKDRGRSLGTQQFNRKYRPLPISL